MQKFIKIAIVGSFFSLWISTLLTENYQIILGFTLIFSFGILHGANDLLLIEQLIKSKKDLTFVKILLYYIVIVIVGAGLFYLIPSFALLLFIVISSFHFGEQQIQNIKMDDYPKTKLLLKFIYGLFILLLLFNFHLNEVQAIVFDIIGLNIENTYISGLFVIFGLLLFTIYLYLYINAVAIRNQILLEIFYLLVFTIIFKSSSLIWGFTIYFILWHSIPSMIDQINFLHGSFSIKNAILYFKSAFLYWIASLLGISILYFLFKDVKLFDALFFSFLASITFPHAVVILKMFEKD